MSEPVTAHLKAGDEARTYAVRDLDELGRAIRAGQIDRVIFPAENVLFAALWDGVLTSEDLRAVKVELAMPAGIAGTVSLAGLFAAWTDWSRRRRRQRTVAGLVLSVVALAAAWGVLALAAWR